MIRLLMFDFEVNVLGYYAWYTVGFEMSFCRGRAVH